MTDAGSNNGADTTCSADRSQVGAWRERLAGKSDRNRRMASTTAEEPAEAGSYWDTKWLFSDPGGELEVAVTPFGVLGLAEGATIDEVSVAFRALAKAHHPDRWVHAGAEIRAEHERSMRVVNEAYGALKQRSKP